MSREVRLARYPDGTPVTADFAVDDVPTPHPAVGEVLVETGYLSMDPVTRVRMSATSRMGPPMRLGAAVEGRGVGRVIASRAPDLTEGELVLGELGWRTHAVLPAAKLERVDAAGLPAHHQLNMLGPTGLAAWFAVDVVGPRDGDTVVVAPAAGGVGSLAVQIARARAPGARVIGIGTGEAQLAFLRGLGVEAADAGEDLSALLASGVDVFIDGVGCDLHERVIRHLNPRARVQVLGFVAGYGGATPPRYGDMMPILLRRATVQGFLLADHMDRAAQAREQLAGYWRDGGVTPHETIWPGLDQAPAAFASLFADAPPGKQIVRVWEND